jgi:hypothetical protein
MSETFIEGSLVAFRTLDQILTAGVAITAFSLLLYAFTLSILRDRVAQSFALILTSVVVVFSTQAISSTITNPPDIGPWLRLQWIGIILLPPAYLHFSDALLASTGKPSRGRRRWAVRITYLLSLGLLILVPTTILVGPLVIDGLPAPHLQRTLLTGVFSIFYGLVIIIAWINFARAYRRTITHASRRRMIYLLAGSTAPALGSYPIIAFNYAFFVVHPVVYWILGTISSIAIGALVITMAYSVAFFGVSWPDRVVKSRLFVWLMRGPVTASIILALTTMIRRAGAAFGDQYNALVPIIMVVSIIILEYGITILAPLWDRWLFYGKDRDDVLLLRTMEDRLLTRNDLHQFLEVVIASICDHFQCANAFIAGLSENKLELIVTAGRNESLNNSQASRDILELVTANSISEDTYRWGEYYLVPLLDHDHGYEHHLLGLLGFTWQLDHSLDRDQTQALSLLSQRATLALRDRRIQQQVVGSLQALTPQVAFIQKLRAVSGFDRSMVTELEENLPQDDLDSWVKDALSHYWGGPKLTQSPLMQFQVVRDAIKSHEGNDANALRAILKKGIETVRPEGDRRFTAEWILYNILEMKFLEGKKVREIASRLAMSEADLYRKQRVAIEAVSKAIMEMEKQARHDILP